MLQGRHVQLHTQPHHRHHSTWPVLTSTSPSVLSSPLLMCSKHRCVQVVATLHNRILAMRKQPIKPCRNRSADARVRVEKPHSAPHRRAGRQERSGLQGPKLCCICNSACSCTASAALQHTLLQLSSLGTGAALRFGHSSCHGVT